MSFQTEMLKVMRRFLLWFFKGRETGAITIAQTPNLALWNVILASVLIGFGTHQVV